MSNSSIPPFRKRPPINIAWSTALLVLAVALMVWAAFFLLMVKVANGQEPPTEADKYTSVELPLTWEERQDGDDKEFRAVVPFAKLIRRQRPNGLEALGIAFENGLSCSALSIPVAPFSMTCGGLGSFYQLVRSGKDQPYKLMRRTLKKPPTPPTYPPVIKRA